MSTFDDQLSLLASCELPHARRDPKRMADMLGALMDALALTCAMAAEGRPDRMSELLDGLTVSLIEGAAEKAPLARMVCEATRR